MNTLRVGMISLAHYSHALSYARALMRLPDVVIAGIYDEEEERGTSAAQGLGTRYCTELSALLNESDAVIVASDNQSHFRYAKAAAESGLHLLVEKPITTEGRDARELIDWCEEHGLVLQTAFPVRLNASVRTAKKRIDQGEIGDIVAIAATNHGKMPGGWFVDLERSGGGAVLDHTVHVVDIMRWLMRSEVKEVYAEMDTLLHDIPVDDCGILSMEFENGVIATLDASWSRPSSFPTWGDVTIRIVGTAGVLHVDAFAQAGSLWVNDAVHSHQFINWGDQSNEALVAEFIASIREDRPSSITGLDGLRAAEAAWAAYESAKAGRPVSVKHY